MSSARSTRGSLSRPLNEASAIERLRRELGRDRPRCVVLDIGDDAAVLQTRASQLVTSIDASAEGVHFDLDWVNLSQAAARALTAAVSDLAAMGASPLAATINIEFPKTATAAAFSSIGRGQAAVAKRWKCPVVGGNLMRGSRWVFTSHVLGGVETPITRGGACAGDEVWLIGEAGLAAVGLHLLQSGFAFDQAALKQLPLGQRKAVKQCLAAWRAPVARVTEGARLGKRATSLIDVSDGLASEARHIAKASGVALEIDAQRVLRLAAPGVSELCEKLGISLLDRALFGGEDYALLATGPARLRPRFATAIGSVLSSPRAQCLLRLPDGRRKELRGAAFDHFTSIA